LAEPWTREQRGDQREVLAEVARRRLKHDEAGSLVNDALHRFAKLGDVAAAGMCIKDLAVLAKERDELERAARLWSVGLVIAQSGGPPPASFPQEIGDLPGLTVEGHDPTLEEALAIVTEPLG
jgi:hypothetical protein